MTLYASDIINNVAKVLNDTSFVRWTLPDHYAYLSEGLRMCVIIQPRSHQTTIAHKLTAGSTRQVLPADAISLIDMPRNLGPDGLTPGYAITIADRQTLDTANAAWHTALTSTYINNYTYDDRAPNTFYVTPPPSVTVDVYVELVYSKNPAAVTALTQALDILDIYQAPLMEYQFYRCFGANTASADDRQLSQQHLGYFYTMLDQKEKAAMMLSPNNPSNVVG